MANTGFYGSNIVNAEWWKDMIQDYLRNMLIGTEICNTKCESLLTSGNTVHFPTVSDVYVQDYTPGTDLTITPLTALDSTLVVDKSKAATFSVDPVEVKQATSKYVPTVTFQAAYDLKNNIDQEIIDNAITSASQNSTSFASLSVSNMNNLMADRKAQLYRNNATDGPLFFVTDADGISTLSLTFIANGFNEADTTLRNGFAGSAGGFQVYATNNLPYSVTLTADTNPTAADTFTLWGVTWTFVANGTAANPGEISIGANIAATQAIIVNAINGTGTPGASTYIDVSVTNRRNLQNRQANSAAFAANASVITGFGRPFQAETFTAGTNVFGTCTTKYLFGRFGAPSLAIQMRPELYIHPEPKQLSMNYMTHTLFGNAVFTRDQQRLVTATINA
jgi:hypothetical protein